MRDNFFSALSHNFYIAEIYFVSQFYGFAYYFFCHRFQRSIIPFNIYIYPCTKGEQMYCNSRWKKCVLWSERFFIVWIAKKGSHLNIYTIEQCWKWTGWKFDLRSNQNQQKSRLYLINVKKIVTYTKHQLVFRMKTGKRRWRKKKLATHSVR